MKRLLLLGAGHAHLQVLRALARQRLAGAEVALVSPRGRTFYAGMLPGLIAGCYDEAQCAVPLPSLVGAAGVELIDASVVRLDATRREVTLSDGRSTGYDVLSVDTGSITDRDAIPGAREHAMFVRPLEPFVQLLPALLDLASQRALDIVMIGGGPAGVELALALHHRLARRGEHASRITLVCGVAAPLPGYPPSAIERAVAALKRHGITLLQEACVEIDATHATLGNGARVACDAPILALGPSAPPWVAASGLETAEHGFIAVGSTLQSVSHAEVFAAGDVASNVDAPHPKNGVHALRAGAPLALNLRRMIAGAELQPHRPQSRTLNLLRSGNRRAIATWGNWSAEGRWAWYWKDHLDRSFIAGFAKPA